MIIFQILKISILLPEWTSFVACVSLTKPVSITTLFLIFIDLCVQPATFILGHDVSLYQALEGEDTD
jgi:hypothetical protein